MMSDGAVLEVRNLSVEFDLRRRRKFRAVSHVDFEVRPGETLGIVGESGSGKTTLGRAVLGLVRPSEGEIRFEGRPVLPSDRRDRKRLAGVVTSVFQDPYTSLNPALPISASLLEQLRSAGVSASESSARMRDVLDAVGLPHDFAHRYPGALSGGQRQRVAIARALISAPRLVVCDESVSALDVSVQAQVLNLLRTQQAGSPLSYLFISHDLDVVRYMSDRVLVLYRGSVMEEGPAETVSRRPAHPYTQALIAAAPVLDPEERKRRPAPRTKTLDDAVATPDQGCPFAPRCPLASEICRTQAPPLEVVAEGVKVACHHYEQAKRSWSASRVAAVESRG